MRKHLAVLSALAALTFALPAPAQTRRNAPAAAAGIIAQLPASDAVVTVDVKRLLNEGLPRAYASNQAELARVNGEIDKFRDRTGLDARQFSQIALGARYAQTPSGATTMDSVAIARGTFNSGALVGAGRLAANGQYQETQYGGKSVYVFNINERVKLLGLFNLNVTELAVSALNANTLAIGKVSRVREAIDAGASRPRSPGSPRAAPKRSSGSAARSRRARRATSTS
jgi:hypothetical protein